MSSAPWLPLAAAIAAVASAGAASGDGDLTPAFGAGGRSIGWTHPAADQASGDPFGAPGFRPPSCAVDVATSFHVAVLYARAFDDDDRYTEVVPRIRAAVNSSNFLLWNTSRALGTDADLRLRCAGGLVEVLAVTLPTPRAQANQTTVFRDLDRLDLGQPRVKPWVYYDEPSTVAGLGTFHPDDRPGSENDNNGNLPTFAVSFNLTDPQLFLHELTHTMGAVQSSAPHTSGAGHCNDGRDVMCYADGGPNSSYVTTACSVLAYDCGADDYFHPSPPAGTYLATHWNVAGRANRYLVFGTPQRIPTPSFRVVEANPRADAPVTFEDASTDADGTVVHHAWDFERGSVANGPRVTRVFPMPGLYNVTLTVTDDDGGAARVTRGVRVGNALPRAEFTVFPTTPTTQGGWFTARNFDADGSAVAFEWDFGDGSNASGPQVYHAFPRSGTYRVRLTVVDDLGEANATALELRVVNTPPSVGVAWANRVLTGQNASFVANAVDRDGTISSIRWDFGDGATAEGAEVIHAWPDDGVYVVEVTVLDDEGGAANRTVEIEILNRPPILDVSLPPGPVATIPARFVASASDRDGRVESIRWDFGGGPPIEGGAVDHAYPDDGEFEITILAIDDDGEETTLSVRVSVANHPPILRYGGPLEADSLRTFRATVEARDPDGRVESIRWGLGGEEIARGQEADLNFTGAGARRVRIAAVDDDGETSELWVTITVRNSPPEAGFEVDSAEVDTGEPIRFVDLSRDPDGDLVRRRWDFGDGNDSTTPYPGHAWAEDGEFEVVLRVVDDDGDADEARRTVRIRNRAPLPSFELDAPPRVGEEAVLRSTAEDPDGGIVAWAWEIGTSRGSDPIARHVFDSPGAHEVRLTVLDDDGSNATLVLPVEVGPGAFLPGAAVSLVLLAAGLAAHVRGRRGLPGELVRAPRRRL